MEENINVIEECLEKVSWLIRNSGITAEEFVKRLTPKDKSKIEKELNAKNT